jgi:hypothetical protein
MFLVLFVCNRQTERPLWRQDPVPAWKSPTGLGVLTVNRIVSLAEKYDTDVLAVNAGYIYPVFGCSPA